MDNSKKKSIEFEKSVKNMLEILGEDPNREGLIKLHREFLRLMSL